MEFTEKDNEAVEWCEDNWNNMFYFVKNIVIMVLVI